MGRSHHRFSILLTTLEGHTLVEVPLSFDWEPLRQCTAFSAMRAGRLPLQLALAERGVVEPAWSSSLGHPFAEGVCVRIASNGITVGEQFTLTDLPQLSSVAQMLGQELVKLGKLAAGDRFRYILTAYADESADPDQADRFTAEPVREEIHCTAGSLGEALGLATPCGRQDASDMPVVVPAQVLDECEEATRGRAREETGGILIGTVHRDDSVPDLFVRVTAQIPARYTLSDVASLEFTPQTWSATRTAVALRRSHEVMLGWWHYHPYAMMEAEESTNEDPPPPRVEHTVFISRQDCELTRACFPAAYSLALVLGETEAREARWGLFGWRKGRLASRGFHLVGDAKSVPSHDRPARTYDA